MTTKVKVVIMSAHMPVEVDVLRSDGTVARTLRLGRVAGTEIEEYVHSSQMLRVREPAPEEPPVE